MTTTEAEPGVPLVYRQWAKVMADVAGLGKHERAQAGQTRFNFRGVDAVMNAVGPALRAHGVMVVPNVIDIQREEFESKNGGRMVGSVVHVEYNIYAEDGTTFGGSAYGEAADSGDKSTPKAMSVAFRTFLLQALTLPTDEPTDPDQHIYERAAATKDQPTKPAGEPATPDQMGEILDLFGALGLDEQRQRRGIAEHTGRVTDVGDLTVEEAEKVLVPLRRAVQNQQAAPSREDAQALIDRAVGGAKVDE